MSRNIFLVRHGHREDFIGDTEQYNYEWAKVSPRRFNPALSTLGRKQACNLANSLKKANIQHIFASPFLRTVQTASFISRIVGVKIKVESGFSEWLNPDWFPSGLQLHTIGELVSIFPGLIESDYSSMITAVFPEPNEHLFVWPRAQQDDRVTDKFLRGRFINCRPCGIGNRSRICAGRQADSHFN